MKCLEGGEDCTYRNTEIEVIANRTLVVMNRVCWNGNELGINDDGHQGRPLYKDFINY